MAINNEVEANNARESLEGFRNALKEVDTEKRPDYIKSDLIWAVWKGQLKGEIAELEMEISEYESKNK